MAGATMFRDRMKPEFLVITLRPRWWNTYSATVHSAHLSSPRCKIQPLPVLVPLVPNTRYRTWTVPNLQNKPFMQASWKNNTAYRYWHSTGNQYIYCCCSGAAVSTAVLPSWAAVYTAASSQRRSTYRYCLRELQYLVVLLDSNSSTVAFPGTTLSQL